MPHPFTDIALLHLSNTDRFQGESYLQRDVVDLPDSAAVRAEVAAMLDNAESPAPEPERSPRPTRRLKEWFPRWIGWLRAMPTP